MKKSLVFLLILAVAGGIFAQEGSFSWSGSVDINGKLDFVGQALEDAVVTTIDDAPIAASVDFLYEKGGLTLAMNFSATAWDDDDGDLDWADNAAAGITAGVTYIGDNFGFHAEMDILNNSMGPYEGPNSLWGYYGFFDNTLRWDVAYRGGGNGTWCVSDIVLEDYWDGWNWLDDAAGFQFTYTGIDDLSFGIMLPFEGFFYDDDITKDVPIHFVNHVLKNFLFGAAYETDALGVSLMVGLFGYVNTDGDDTMGANLHLGFFYNLNDDMTVAFDAAGIFGNADSGESDVGFSVGLDFDASFGDIGAGVKIGFYDFADTGMSGEYGGMAFDICPRVSYAFTEEVSVGLDLKFAVGLGSDTTTKNMMAIEASPYVTWDVGPANFTIGYCLNYNLDSSEVDTSEITMAFHWSF